MNAIIKKLLLIVLSLLSIRCMCYCPLAYDPRFTFLVESGLLNLSPNQLEPFIINANGDTLRLSSSYSIYENLINVYWAYDFESRIENQRIISAIELKNENDSVMSTIILDTFNFTPNSSYTYHAYTRNGAEPLYNHEYKYILKSIVGNGADTLFISKPPSIEIE